MSKYTAILPAAGAFAALASTKAGRSWLGRPQPWCAAALALFVFSPAIVWNAQHGWASIAFQSGRAGVERLRPEMVLAQLGGQAAYLLPWIWVPLLALLVDALRHGPLATGARPDQPRRWLLACMGVLPIVLFTSVALWSSRRVLPHWAAPGYLFLFPLLGDWIAAHAVRLKPYITASAALVLALLLLVIAELHFGFLPPSHGVNEIAAELADWSAVRQAVSARNLAPPGTFIAATGFRVAGKIDYALGGTVPVAILDPDSRQYGFAHPAATFAGQNAVIMDDGLSEADARARFGGHFANFRRLEPVEITAGGRTVLVLDVYAGDGYRP